MNITGIISLSQKIFMEIKTGSKVLYPYSVIPVVDINDVLKGFLIASTSVKSPSKPLSVNERIETGNRIRVISIAPAYLQAP